MSKEEEQKSSNQRAQRSFKSTRRGRGLAGETGFFREVRSGPELLSDPGFIENLTVWSSRTREVVCEPISASVALMGNKRDAQVGKRAMNDVGAL